jgi:hypothetical protein
VTTSPKPPTLAGAVHSNCTCLKCRIGNATWIRERRAAIKAGTWKPWADATPVRAHVEKLHADGMPYALIARLADVDPIQIRRIRGTAGARIVTKIRTDTAEALLAVRLNYSHLPAKSAVPGQGTRRRIQALRAIGWPSYAIADLAGIGQRTIYEALLNTHVRAATHRAVASLYEVLHDQDPAQHGVARGIIRRGQRHANQQGWALPTAWTDIDLDDQPDPRARTVVYSRLAPGDRSRAVVENTAELARLGVVRQEIAQRIGITWDSIERTHIRAGVPLPRTEIAA